MRLRISLKWIIVIGFSMALLILAVVGGAAYRSTVLFAESASVVSRSHQVIAKLEATMGDLANAESEARGFVITGSENCFSLYRRFATEVESDMAQLRALVIDPTIKQGVARIEDLIQQRLARLKATVETRRLKGFEAASKLAGPGKKVMDEVREAVDAVEALENALLNDRAELAKSLSRRTTTVVVIGSLLAMLVAGASTLVMISDIAHRERLEQEVMQISEREQRRIGHDLHDGLCQQLTGTAMLSHALESKLASISTAGAADAKRVTELINVSIEEARRVTHGLHPVPDGPRGLMMALGELAATVRRLSKLGCQFDCPETVAIPDRTAATHLFRIAQEATQNAMRHAKAASIAIALRDDEDTIALTVSDDGCGLPERRSRKGLGLEIMDYRARAIGATLTVRRGEKRGTVVECSLPRAAFNAFEETS